MLNRSRTLYRHAFVTALGVAVAFSGKQPKGWAEALDETSGGTSAVDSSSTDPMGDL